MYVPSQSPVYSTIPFTENQNEDPTFSAIYRNVKSIISSTMSDDEKSVTITRMFMNVINNCEKSLVTITKELKDSQETIKRLKYRATLTHKGVLNYESQILALEDKIKEIVAEKLSLSYENTALKEERTNIEQRFNHYKFTVSFQRQQDAWAFSELEMIAEERKNSMEILSERINDYSLRVNSLVRTNTGLRRDIHDLSNELNLGRLWSRRTRERLMEVTRERDVLKEQVVDLQGSVLQIRQENITQVQELQGRIAYFDVQVKTNAEIQRIKLAFINHATIQTYNDCKGTANYLANMYFPSWFTDITPPHEDLSAESTPSKNIFIRISDGFLSIGRAKNLEQLLEKEALEYPNKTEKERLDQLMKRIGYGCLIRPEEEYLR